MSEWTPLKNIDPDCFGCGQENEHGLKMQFATNGKRLRSYVTIPDHLRGWSNLAHGGVLSTILDEAMGWSAIHLFQRFILTKEMVVRFKKPVWIGAKVMAEGFIAEEIDARNVVMKAEIRNEKGELCVESEATFALFKPESFKKLQLVPEDLLDEMTKMFRGEA